MRSASGQIETAGKTVEKGLLIVTTGPGKGKSTSAFGLALRMLGQGRGVIAVDLGDMHVPVVGERDWDRLVAASGALRDAPLAIDEQPSLNILAVRNKVRRVRREYGRVGLLVVDYLQLMVGDGSEQNRNGEIEKISRGLKSLAKELNVPVLVLSQLNRSAEKEDRTPRLSDLRESGSIEQDADVVLMLARPKEADEKFQVAADSAELIVAKQRNGPVGDLKLTFIRDITRFENYTP